MPSGHVKKQVVIDKLSTEMSKATVGVILDYRGFTMAQMTELRNELYKNNAKMAIIKNTLMKRALKGTELEGVSSALKGPSAIIYGLDDMVAPVKVYKDFLKRLKKDKEHQVRGGFVDGKVISAKEADELANLPPLEELRAKLVGCLAAPGQRLVMAINSQNQSLVRALQQIAEQKQA